MPLQNLYNVEPITGEDRPTSTVETQEQWQPTLHPQLVQASIEGYKRNPTVFNEDYVNQLQQHADYYGMPFRREAEEEEFSILGTLAQAGQGYFEGFTTFRIGDEPGNVYERIARNIGHLAGFVGVVPGAGLLGRTIGLTKTAQKLSGLSVPMLLGKKATKAAEKVGRLALKRGAQSQQKAVQAVTKFLAKDKAKDIMSGAFHLGAATAVSSWQGGIDQMMEGFIGGAVTGGVFRSIGNLVDTGHELSDKALRMLSSSLFTGLPASMRGATAPEQIYEYLLGAYFGYKEAPIQKRKYEEFKIRAEREGLSGTEVPEQVSMYNELSRPLKNYVRQQWFKDKQTEEALNISAAALRTSGRDPENFNIDVKVNEFGEPTVDIQPKRTGEKEVEIISPREVYEGPEGTIKVRPAVMGVRRATPEEVTSNRSLLESADNLDIGQTPQVPMQISTWLPRKFDDQIQNMDPFQKHQFLNEQSVRVQKKVDELTRETTKNRVDEFESWFKKEYNKEFTFEDRNEFTKWFERRITGKQAQFVTVIDGVVKEMSLQNPMTRAGNSKMLIEPPKVVEEAYRQRYKEVTGEEMKPEESVYVIHDHYTYSRKEGKRYEDKAFGDLEHQYRSDFSSMSRGERAGAANQYGIQMQGREPSEVAREYAKEKLYDEFANTAVQLHQKGYHYLSGRGDNERNYFVRYHPDLPETTRQRNSTLGKILTEIAPSSDMSTAQLRAEFNKDRAEFVKRFTRNGMDKDKARQMYNDTFISNVLYQMQLNGQRTVNQYKNINKTGLRRILQDGYITDPIKFNKRQQIFFTNGFPVREELVKWENIPGAENKRFNYTLVKTAEDRSDYKGQIRIGDKSEKYVQVDDGHIVVRRDLMKELNRATGSLDKTEEAAQLKNFIISQDPKLGTLLSKHMMHVASEQQSKAMEEAGIHMIIPTTAGKQIGERKSSWRRVNEKGEYEFYADENFKNKIEPDIYEMRSTDIRSVFSEVTDVHYTEPQRIPKQMWTNLTPFAQEPIDKNVMKDMYSTLVEKEFRGTEEANRLANNLMKDPENLKLQGEVLDRLDDINIETLMKLIRTNGMEDFAAEALTRIMKISRQYSADMVAEGEMPMRNMDNFNQSLEDFYSGTDRLLRLNQKLPVFLHKYSRQYVQQVLRNYVVHRVARPRVDNSIVARMRPLDEYLKRTDVGKRLNENDDVFLLDRGFRNTKLQVDFIPGASPEKPQTITFGELWDNYQKSRYTPEVNKKVEQFLEGVSVRVPMDSISGADVLKFAGFTDRSGYGINLSARSMEMLGGADLDGDKAWMFFGWKQSWKDMYKRNRNEYVETDPETGERVFIDAKARHTNGRGADLAQGGAEIQDSLFLFSPSKRYEVSQGAYLGRKRLGPNVVAKQVITGAHAYAMEQPNQTATRKFIDWKESRALKKEGELNPGEFVVYEVNARARDNMKEFNEIARASINIAADPMDFARSSTPAQFLRMNMEAAFEMSGKRQIKRLKNVDELNDTREVIREETLSALDLSTKHLRNSIYKTFNDVNRAFFGRNWDAGRSFTYDEIVGLTEAVRDIPSAQRNTFLPMVANTLRNVNWSDNLMGRLNKNYMYNVYRTYQEALQRGDYDDFLKKIGREGYGAVPMTKPVKTAFWGRFWRKAYREKVAKDDELYAGLQKQFPNIMWYKGRNTRKRAAMLERLYTTAEDMVVNDISDMTTVTMLARRTSGMNAEVVRELFDMTAKLKEQSYLLKEQRMAAEEGRNLDPEKLRLKAAERVSATKDQADIDAAIMEYKQKLNAAEKEVFDLFLLGTIEKPGEPTTRTTHLAINSRSVSDQSLVSFFETYNNFFQSALDRPVAVDRTRILDQLTDPNKVATSSDVRANTDLFEAWHARESIDNTMQRAEKATGGDQFYYARGLKGQPETKEGKELAARIKNHIELFPQLNSNTLPEFFEFVTSKAMNSKRVTMEDWKDVDRFLTDIRNGSWWSRLFTQFTGKLPKLTKKYYMMFPKAIDRDLLRRDLQFVTKTQPVWIRRGEKEFAIEKEVKQPVNALGRLQDIIHKGQELQQSEKQRYEKELDIELFNMQSINNATTKNLSGSDLFSMMVAGREIGKWSRKPGYENGMISVVLHQKQNGVLKEAAAMEAIRNYRDRWNKWNETYETVKGQKINIKFNKSNLETLKELGYVEKGAEFKGQDDFRIDMTVDKYLKFLDRTMTNWTRKVFNGPFMGDSRKLAAYTNEDGSIRLHEVLSDWLLKIRRGESMDVFNEFNFGLHGLNKVAKEMKILATSNADLKTELRNTEIDPPGELPAEFYFPHINRNPSEAKSRLKESAKKILNDKSLTTEEQAEELQKVLIKYKGLDNDYMFEELKGWSAYDMAVNKMRERQEKFREFIQVDNTFLSVGSMKRRSGHLPGYGDTPAEFKEYMGGLIDANYRQISHILNRSVIWQFKKTHLAQTRNAKGEVDLDYQNMVFNWENFLKLYAQDALGYPSNIPRYVLDNPGMNIKGTPYHWFADSSVKNKLDAVWKKMGTQKELPEELRELSFGQLKHWSNLEAKFELMSLLAHPKTAAANLFGGTTFSMVSAGPRNWLDGSSTRWLTQNVSSRLKTKKDIDDFVMERGVIEEFITKEAGLAEGTRSKKFDSFLREATEQLREDPMMEDKSVLQIAKKWGIGENIFEAGAWFMRKTERVLRRDSYMAHFVQAYKKFSQGVKDPINSEFLHQMAKKGVRSTQFLYSAAFRPAFSRTALGKVMTRFHMWAWNSVRFRKDIINEAKKRGFRQGTQEFDRFRRLITTDLFTLGLANVFAWSLFENALPQPWGWFKDTAEWLFGDEEEREQAFFGAYPTALAPLQAVTPPVMRMLPPLFKSMMEQDYERLSEYYIWTMFPFGRLARDAKGVIESPIAAINRTTGLPFLQLHGELRKRREEEYISPEGILRLLPKNNDIEFTPNMGGE